MEFAYWPRKHTSKLYPGGRTVSRMLIQPLSHPHFQRAPDCLSDHFAHLR